MSCVLKRKHADDDTNDEPCVKRQQDDRTIIKKASPGEDVLTTSSEEEEQSECESEYDWDTHEWELDDLKTRDNILASVPSAKKLISLAGAPPIRLQSTPLPQALDSENLRAALYLILGDLHAALGLSVIPR
jgi:hypothetical protein